MAVLVREPQSGCLCDLGSAVGGFLEVQQDAMKVSLLRFSRELSEVWLPRATARTFGGGSSHAGRLWLRRQEELTCGTGHRREDTRSKLMPAGVELRSVLIDVVADERNHPPFVRLERARNAKSEAACISTANTPFSAHD